MFVYTDNNIKFKCPTGGDSWKYDITCFKNHQVITDDAIKGHKYSEVGDVLLIVSDHSVCIMQIVRITVDKHNDAADDKVIYGKAFDNKKLILDWIEFNMPDKVMRGTWSEPDAILEIDVPPYVLDKQNNVYSSDGVYNTDLTFTFDMKNLKGYINALSNAIGQDQINDARREFIVKEDNHERV